ncbi:MAG: hypothetical protein ACYTF9_09565 [Planctomycetota bacterium]|jgi:hypothetical protein
MVNARPCFLDTAATIVAFASTPALFGQSVVVEYERAGAAWLLDNPTAAVIAYDEYFPGIAPNNACLSGGPAPVTLALPGGTVTVSAFDAGRAAICTIGDGSSVRSVSDASLLGGGTVVLEFDPQITAFYSLFGSVAAGQDVTMDLFAPDGALVETVFSSPSPHNAKMTSMGPRWRDLDGQAPGTSLKI